MTLRLTIEHSPHPQDRREMRHPGGEFSIGRGAECSWQINDPDMYVSRKHCVITGEAGQFIVTDASRGGLFIDGKDQPLGAGQCRPAGIGDAPAPWRYRDPGRVRGPGPHRRATHPGARCSGR
jgi:hypothetical protein